jgi:hypothetical protein
MPVAIPVIEDGEPLEFAAPPAPTVTVNAVPGIAVNEFEI